MEFVWSGAEARVYKTVILGKEILVKYRNRKRYRVTELDMKIRKERTRNEARIMSRMHKEGIRVPRIVAVGRFSIFMELLHGTLLKDIEPEPGGFSEIGRMLATIHDQNVSHGDFTPANIMLCGKSYYVIDFGLAETTNGAEEKALDLFLMKRSVPSAAYREFESAYAASSRNSREVIGRLKGIERRGRYQVRTLV